MHLRVQPVMAALLAPATSRPRLGSLASPAPAGTVQCVGAKLRQLKMVMAAVAFRASLVIKNPNSLVTSVVERHTSKAELRRTDYLSCIRTIGTELARDVHKGIVGVCWRKAAAARGAG